MPKSVQEKLKQQKSPVTKRNLPGGDDPLQIPVTLRYDYQLRQEIEQVVTITWDEFILASARQLQVGSTLSEIVPVIESQLWPRLLDFMAKHIGAPEPEYVCRISAEKLERILKTLMAKKLVKMQASYYGSWSDPRWQFTPKGLQHLAELESITG